MFDFVRLWRFGTSFSLVLTICSILLLFFKPLNFGIDFTGGALIEVQLREGQFSQKMIAEISSSLEEFGVKNVIQTEGTRGLIVKLQADVLDQKIVVEKAKKVLSMVVLGESIKTEIEASPFGIPSEANKLENEFKEDILSDESQIGNQALDTKSRESNLIFNKVDFMGAQVSQEFFFKSSLAIVFSLIGIMIYLIVRFDWRFAIGGLVGLIHDVILVFGFISLFSIEFNMIAVTAILTVIGYSINDSVIIYDRIREVLRLHRSNSIEENINLSLNNTMTRTIYTSLTTLLSAGALIIFGGKELYSFSYVVFFGILVGTYSSIFIAAPCVSLFKKDFKPIIVEEKNAH
jgi:preprotein translocase subunit SecF